MICVSKKRIFFLQGTVQDIKIAFEDVDFGFYAKLSLILDNSHLETQQPN